MLYAVISDVESYFMLKQMVLIMLKERCDFVSEIEEKLKTLPEKPGVYIMHGKDDEVIYVGKAKI